MNQALYSATELKQQLEQDSNTLLVAVCSQEDFDAGHIPGSVHLLPTALTLNEKPAPGLLPPIDRLQASLENLGLNPKQAIIAYDNAGGSVAGRFIWTLALFNINNTAMLNGGLKAWQQAKLTLETQAPTITPSSLTLTINPHFLATQDEVLDSLNDSNTVIWDARGEDEYAGEKVLAARGGHIPNAISHNWVHLHDANQAIKNLDEIQAELNAKGLSADKTIITHCQTHRRSGLTWFVAHKLLGYRNIKAYAGSWSQWGNNPDLPIE